MSGRPLYDFAGRAAADLVQVLIALALCMVSACGVCAGRLVGTHNDRCPNARGAAERGWPQQVGQQPPRRFGLWVAPSGLPDPSLRCAAAGRGSAGG